MGEASTDVLHRRICDLQLISGYFLEVIQLMDFVTQIRSHICSWNITCLTLLIIYTVLYSVDDHKCQTSNVIPVAARPKFKSS